MTQRTFHIGMNGVARITQEVGPFLPVNCSMSSAHGVLLKEDNGNIGKSEMIFVERTLSVIRIQFLTTECSNNTGEKIFIMQFNHLVPHILNVVGKSH